MFLQRSCQIGKICFFVETVCWRFSVNRCVPCLRFSFSSWLIEEKRGAFGLVITQLLCALLKQPHIALPPHWFLVCGSKHSHCQVHRHAYQMHSRHAGLWTLVFPRFNEYISAHHIRLVAVVAVCTKSYRGFLINRYAPACWLW